MRPFVSGCLWPETCMKLFALGARRCAGAHFFDVEHRDFRKAMHDWSDPSWVDIRRDQELATVPALLRSRPSRTAAHGRFAIGGGKRTTPH